MGGRGMSAETLRRAAALMRERATDARAGTWLTAPSDLTPDATLVLADWQHEPRRVATCAGSLPEGNLANADHIASWHPAVALAVADCIDAALCYFDPDEFSEAEREMHDSLLTLARTYLNESA